MNSMTGFGAGTAPLKGGTLRVELSGVNRKQFELAHNLPRNWASLEAGIRSMVGAQVSRGRVNLSINVDMPEGESNSITINTSKLHALKEQISCLEQGLGQSISISLDSLARLHLLEESNEAEISPEEAWEALEAATSEALYAFTSMRRLEGEAMKSDLLDRIEKLRSMRLEMMQLSAGVAARYKETLLTRLAESGLPLPQDDERIIKEIALFADRCDTSEETTRLASHLEQFCVLSEKSEPLGRTLDFLCQEIFRELNTTGSKANDAQLAQLVVTAKTELEKIREQVQNIE